MNASIRKKKKEPRNKKTKNKSKHPPLLLSGSFIHSTPFEFSTDQIFPGKFFSKRWTRFGKKKRKKPGLENTVLSFPLVRSFPVENVLTVWKTCGARNIFSLFHRSDFFFRKNRPVGLIPRAGKIPFFLNEWVSMLPIVSMHAWSPFLYEYAKQACNSLILRPSSVRLRRANPPTQPAALPALAQIYHHHRLTSKFLE